MPYVAEPIPEDLLKDLLDTYWDPQGGSIPEPQFIIANEAIAIDLLNVGDAVVLRLINMAETQRGHEAAAADLVTRVRLEFHSVASLQRIYDLMQETRRILYTYKHALSGYQRIRYGDFNRETTDQAGYWMGFMNIQLESAGIPRPTDIIFSDLFAGADDGLGANWTGVTGTWNTLSNKARESVGVANSLARVSGVTTYSAGRMTCNVTLAAPLDCGIMFRGSNSTNFWALRGVVDGGINYLELVKVEAGVTTVMARYRAPGFVAGETHQLEVICRDTEINGWYDGYNLLRVFNSFNQSATWWGLYANVNTAARFDDVYLYR